MDRYHAYRIFTQVAEKLSFSRAALELALPKATVSTLVQDLEAHLGVKLLNRTTRRVTLTPEGLTFLERCKAMLLDSDEAEAMFRNAQGELKGKVRVDMGVTAAKEVVIPRLPEFLDQHPEVEVELSCTDHWVNLQREGIDCVLRGGMRANPG